MTATNKRLTKILMAVPLLLLIPLIAMQLTNEVNWDAFDFMAMGMLLLVTGLLSELALRMLKDKMHRLIAIAVILLLFLFIWGELATGFFRRTLQGHTTIEMIHVQPFLVV